MTPVVCAVCESDIGPAAIVGLAVLIWAACPLFSRHLGFRDRVRHFSISFPPLIPGEFLCRLLTSRNFPEGRSEASVVAGYFDDDSLKPRNPRCVG